MTFFVEKRLALGPIRFGVSPRKKADAIDESRDLSTGAGGEFVRRRGEGFFFGGNDRFDAPTLPTAPSIRSTPFWTSLKRRRALLALAVLGIVFVLLGFAVIARKGPQGWVEVILGIAMIATPIVMTAQERKKIAEQEERERAEREAMEARNRQMLAAYVAALDRVQHERSDATFEQLEAEHQTLTLPRELWSPIARRTALLIGFDELAKRGVDRARDVAEIMSRASRAAGLSPDEENAVRLDLYRGVLWHLLADDRLGPIQQDLLLSLRKGLDIWDRDVPVETKAAEEFNLLRGVATGNLPRRQCTTALSFKEYCIHETNSDVGMLHITNKNLVVDGKKRSDHPLPSLSDVTAHIDESSVSLRDPLEKMPIHFRF
jgi:hypothetical protein